MTPEKELIQILRKRGINFMTTLPCDRIKKFHALISKHFRHVPLTREEEGVGICAGAALAGAKPAMLIQSSGMGNMINALCSLTKVYQLPLSILISWRGIYNEDIPAQIPLGKHLRGILDALGINYTSVQERSDIFMIETALENAYQNNAIHAILLSPKIWERSDYKATVSSLERKKIKIPRRKNLHPTLTRYEIIREAAPYLEGKVVVCNLGMPSKELYHLKHQKSNFYMLGSMGMASSIGLGIAVNTAKKVIVIDGDGSLLMNLGSLATIAQIKPKNLSILAVDNAAYGSTGNQPTPTRYCADLELAAVALGFEKTYKIATLGEIRRTFEKLTNGPNFIHALAKPGDKIKINNIPLTPVEIKNNVMEFLNE